MIDLALMQSEMAQWRERNFPPEHRNAVMQTLGVCEESGELAHAVLKREQGIRGTDDEHLLAAADAMGDIVIYLAGLCDALHLDLELCIINAWQQVKKRNWVENPETGEASGA